MPLRHRRVSHPQLLQIYAEEAARLRKLAASVTTTGLRARLLEEANDQDRLAQAVAEPSSHLIHVYSTDRFNNRAEQG